MNWQQLISTKRLGQEDRPPRRHDERPEFKRDYDRLIFSAPFRRLQNKTQVFPLPGSVFVHNRLTHSLEVASVGSSLAADVARQLCQAHPELRGTLFEEIDTIVSAACLAHDMGNPPFGHSGEKAIQTFFTEGPGQELRPRLNDRVWADITRFDGNANAFRLLTHRFNGRREGGFAMTYTTLATIVKYPSPALTAKKNKFGYFTSEQPIYERIVKELGAEGGVRHPLVYLVEAADDICYQLMDMEDAHKLKILTFEETTTLMLSFFDEERRARIWQRISDEQITDDNEKIVYMRACAIGLLERECAETFVKNEAKILDGTFEGSLTDNISQLPREAFSRCAQVARQRIYNSKPVLDVELSGYRIMETLMEQMMEAVIHPDRYYSRQLIGRVSSQYDIENPDLEARVMAVLDYISGMTDVYALDVYQKICGLSLPIV